MNSLGLGAQLIRVSETEFNLFSKEVKLFESKFHSKEITMTDWYFESVNYFNWWEEASEELDDDYKFIDLYHFWQGIIYIMTGGSMEEIEDEKEGSEALNALGSSFFHIMFLDPNENSIDCPISSFTIEDVREINSELQKFDSPKILKQLNGKWEIYFENWTEPETIEILIEFFNELKDFYQKASDNNEAILTLMSMRFPKITIGSQFD